MRSVGQRTSATVQDPAELLGQPVDARVQRSKERILAATLELLFVGGLSGVTVDRIAERSGVAKTTIYRHWRTRSEIVIEACARISTPQTVPDTGSLRGDLLALETDLASMLGEERWASVLPSIIDGAERDPELAEVHRRIQRAQVRPYLAVIEKGRAAGVLPADTDADAVVSLLIGPLFYRRWFSREPLGPDFLGAVVDAVLPTPS